MKLLKRAALALGTFFLFSLAVFAQQVTNAACPSATGTDPHCVVFTWTPATLGTGYRIYSEGTTKGACATVTAPTCTKILDVAGLATATATFNTSATSQLTEGATYYYVITTVNGTAESAPSAEVSANAVPFLVPNPPASPQASAK